MRYQKHKSLGNLQVLNTKTNKKLNLMSTSSVKNIIERNSQSKSSFTLPKITRISQEKFENQSIIKTLNYLYQVMGKQEEMKIRKVLELNNP